MEMGIKEFVEKARKEMESASGKKNSGDGKNQEQRHKAPWAGGKRYSYI